MDAIKVLQRLLIDKEIANAVKDYAIKVLAK